MNDRPDLQQDLSRAGSAPAAGTAASSRAIAGRGSGCASGHGRTRRSRGFLRCRADVPGYEEMEVN
jgi:hypothetical protein